MKAPFILRALASFAAFFVPGMSLWLPSGYSYGATLLLVTALLGIPWWWRVCRVSVQSRWLLLSIMVMGSVWFIDSFDSAWRWGTLDRPAKYLLALPCLLFLLAFTPRVRYLWWGIAVGAIGSGAMALYQVGILHLSRATGYTNAIQYGNLCLLLALMCLVVLTINPPGIGRWHRFAMALGMLSGLIGSALSQTRGGWVALALVLPMLVLVLRPFLTWRQSVGSVLLLLCMVSAVVFTQRSGMEERFDEARNEVLRYEILGDASSSVGQRLAHWRLAWNMGLERPVFGWGKTGYDIEKLRRVNAGQVDPFVLQFGHVHNEVLDLFAKHGLVGALALLLFYIVPLVLFWPTRRRVSVYTSSLDAPLKTDGRTNRTLLTLYLTGWLIPMAYIGFGLTQVFFAHNSGNVVYLFMIIIVHSIIQDYKREILNPSDNAYAY